MSWSPVSHIRANKFEAALFDFDGTLVDSEQPYIELFSRILHSHGLQVPTHKIEALSYGRSWTDAVRDAIDEWPILTCDAGKLASQIEQAINDHGGVFGLPIAPAIHALTELALSMPVAIVSGSFRSNLTAAIETLGLTECVDLIVGAEDYECGKPSPEPFLVAADRLGVPPERCVVFEDSTQGIESAISAGMTCITVRTNGQNTVSNGMTNSLDSSHGVKFRLHHKRLRSSQRSGIDSSPG